MGDDKAKRGLAALIISSAKPKVVEHEEEHSEGDPGLESAAEDILKAIKEDDVKGLVESLGAFCSMCDQHEKDSEEE